MMRKVHEKWIDEDTGISAEISPGVITIIPGTRPFIGRSGEKVTHDGFVFRNSKRETARKVVQSLTKLLDIQNTMQDSYNQTKRWLTWAQEEEIITESVTNE